MTSNERLIDAMNRGYTVDSDGNVISPMGRMLKACLRRGYERITIRFRDGTKRGIMVHRLIALYKFGRRMFKPGIEVRHLDGDKKNNSWSNIDIGTPHDNRMDIPRMIRIQLAVNAARTLRSLSDDDLNGFRADRARGMSLMNLARKYHIAKSTASYIANGRTYKDAENVSPIASA